MRDTTLTMVAFMQAQNCSNYVGSWRHPATMRDFLAPEYYRRIARTLEDGLFHACFFDDRLAMPDAYGGDYRSSVENGIRCVKLDPTVPLMMMGTATRHLGLGTTYSTTYYEPFHVARLFQTMDLMFDGRMAWNVVTSLNDTEAANFGHEAHLEHDLRYDRADEFMEVVLGLMDSWEDDAIVADKSGRFADPAKVHQLDHTGRFFKSRGPLPVPRSAQGRPVLLQAGQSGRGRRFASRWGDMIFALYPSLSLGQRIYRDFKNEVAACGRRPDEVKVLPAIYVVVGETGDIARQKLDLIDRCALPIDALSLMSEVLNFDFAKKGDDEPFTEAEMASIGGMQTLRDRVVEASGKANPTVIDFAKHSGRGTVREFPVFVGSPQEVADGLQEWFEGEACDGFVLAATHLPGAYEDFVRLVVPELQRRGLYRTAYDGATLRSNLGLPRAEVGDWKAPGEAPAAASA